MPADGSPTHKGRKAERKAERKPERRVHPMIEAALPPVSSPNSPTIAGRRASAQPRDHRGSLSQIPRSLPVLAPVTHSSNPNSSGEPSGGTIHSFGASAYMSNNSALGADSLAERSNLRLQLLADDNPDVSNYSQINPWTLSFSDEEDERRFSNSRLHLMLPRLRVAAVTVLVYLTFKIAISFNDQSQSETIANGVLLALHLGAAALLCTLPNARVYVRQVALLLTAASYIGILIDRAENESQDVSLETFLLFFLFFAVYHPQLVDLCALAVVALITFVVVTVSYVDSAGWAGVICAPIVFVLLTLFHVAMLAELRERESFVYLQRLKRAKEQLVVERCKSEMLLNNIYPKSIAERISQNQDATFSDYFEQGTIAFVDIVGFTQMSGAMPPHDVVRLLNMVFGSFDRLATRYNLEKIKTIGDSYMVAGGVPIPRPDSAECVCHMALDMVESIKRIGKHEGRPLQVRVGIHTGPVHAGIIGQKKRCYDLFGEGVSVAYRLEPLSQPMRINVSESTRALVKDKFFFEPRSSTQFNGVGDLKMYFLAGRKCTPPTKAELAKTGKQILESFLATGQPLSHTAHFLLTTPPTTGTYTLTQPDKDAPEMSKVSLEFNDAEFEKGFQSDYADLTYNWAQVVFWLVELLVFNVAWGAVDAYLYPDRHYLFALRYALSVPAVAFALVYIWSPMYQRLGNPPLLAALVVLSVSVYVKLFWLASDDTEAGFLYAGVEHFVLGMFLAVSPRVRFRHAAVLMTVNYVVVVVLFAVFFSQEDSFERGIHLRPVWEYVVLLFTPFLAMQLFSSYATEASIRREFTVREMGEQKRERLAQEEFAAEHLILSILPRQVYQKLRSNNNAGVSEFYPESTVIFASVVHFSRVCEGKTTEDRIQVLNEFFSMLDGITDLYSLEKIKNFGATYMAAGGLTDQQQHQSTGQSDRDDHQSTDEEPVLIRALRWAQRVRRDIGKHEFSIINQPLQVRIGIHTGPLVGGVIGETKFQFDVWGNTVNVASRMATTAPDGCIHVSEDVFQASKAAFAFEPREKVVVKGKGMMTTFLLVDGDD